MANLQQVTVESKQEPEEQKEKEVKEKDKDTTRYVSIPILTSTTEQVKQKQQQVTEDNLQVLVLTTQETEAKVAVTSPTFASPILSFSSPSSSILSEGTDMEPLSLSPSALAISLDKISLEIVNAFFGNVVSNDATHQETSKDSENNRQNDNKLDRISRDSGIVCRICWGSASEDESLISTGCQCVNNYVHETCLSKWVKINHRKEKLVCEICLHPYNEGLRLVKKLKKFVADKELKEESRIRRDHLIAKIIFCLSMFLMIIAVAMMVVYLVVFAFTVSNKDV